MKYFIFTRFNLMMSGENFQSIYNHPKINDPEAWMEHRIILFEKYTLPSVLAQTDKDFTWLLAFDKQTPENILTRYDYIDNIHIIYEYPKFWIQNKIYDEWLITSRLDNDDYIYPTYIEEIKKAFRRKEEVIDVEYIQFDYFTGKYYTSDRYPPNGPFLSLVEYVEMDGLANTCFFCSHTKMPDNFPARKINKVLAKMIIHDRNISNHIVGKEIQL